MPYQTKGLDCWKWAKELRANAYADIYEAREKGKLLITGGAASFYDLPAGFGDYEYFAGEPYGASIAHLPEWVGICDEATEERGYARDLCAYMRHYWGSMFLNKGPFGEGFPKPDFAFQEHICDSHGKWFQIVAEYLGIPYFCIDYPTYFGQVKEHHIQRLIAQFHDFVDWGEKLLGRKFDDERFLKAMVNSDQVRCLWAEVCALNKAIPAPLDQKTMFSLYLPAVMLRQKKEGIDFYTTLRDEVKDRVANRIAAEPNERCRLWHDNLPPWFALRFFREAQKYGAVFVGSHYGFLWGSWDILPDGTVTAAQSLAESGRVPQSRDEAFRFMAEWALLKQSICPGGGLLASEGKLGALRLMLPQFHVDGVVFHLNRGCEGISVGQMECKLMVERELGLPTVTYEGNAGDPREYNETQVLDRLETFLVDRLGLTKLVD